jgi:hypothetical protein
MQRMVYYPGFEVANSTWLKFALLYINTLRPIIPPNGYNYLSNQHRMLKEETDLIVPLCARQDHGGVQATRWDFQ